MALYSYVCERCSKSIEVLLPMEHNDPACCGSPMRRIYTGGVMVKIKYPMWVDRIEDIHKAQEQKGERLRMVHPSEVL